MARRQPRVSVRAAPRFALVPPISAETENSSASHEPLLRAGLVESDNPSRAWVFRVEGPLSLPDPPGVDWRRWADLLLFLSLIALGLRLVSASRESVSGLGFLGPLLFNAGLTPFVLSLWALASGSALFRRENLVKSLFSGAVFSAGFALWQISEAGGNKSVLESLLSVDAPTLVAVFGPAFLEIGVLFFVEKAFFLDDGDEVKIEKLEQQLVEARRGMGVGLAASYFYNFLLPTASNLANGETPVDVEVSRGTFRPAVLSFSRLFVLVPRSLDESSDIKGTLRDLSQNGVLQGKPKERDVVGHRPLFGYLLPAISDNDGATAATAASDSTTSIEFFFDIPTIVSSIFYRHADVQQQRAESNLNRHDGGEAPMLDVDVSAELLDFQNSLVAMVQANGLTRERVVVVSTASAALQADDIRLIAERVRRDEP
jgi:hypothetical protein